jgi:hypothetical protein
VPFCFCSFPEDLTGFMIFIPNRFVLELDTSFVISSSISLSVSFCDTTVSSSDTVVSLCDTNCPSVTSSSNDNLYNHLGRLGSSLELLASIQPRAFSASRACFTPLREVRPQPLSSLLPPGPILPRIRSSSDIGRKASPKRICFKRYPRRRNSDRVRSRFSDHISAGNGTNENLNRFNFKLTFR